MPKGPADPASPDDHDPILAPRSASLPNLTLLSKPRKLPGSTLLIALTGWMDGGFVSTGTVKHLMQGRDLKDVARIEPGGFYVDNFPGSMEIAAVFRPEVKYTNGLVTRFEFPANTFHLDEKSRMLFFVGKEPNINWPAFAQCIFNIALRTGIKRICFMGSFGGTVPHTREPRLFGSVSDPSMLQTLARYGLKPSDYEGPASFASYLLYLAPQYGMDMISIAAEIPGYLQGINPLSIEAVTKRLAGILDLEVDFAALRQASTEWELKVTEAVEEDEELAHRVRKLEEEYDNELISDE
jgi:proteasome assembly chaperone (PAC2) family protein